MGSLETAEGVGRSDDGNASVRLSLFVGHTCQTVTFIGSPHLIKKSK
jgi:hypothetical protein